ncbi:hypothetical protein ACR218_003829 [Salmonella enterica]
MLSISSIRGDAGYYSHKDNYYASGSLESRWLGEGAERLGLKARRIIQDRFATYSR